MLDIAATKLNSILDVGIAESCDMAASDWKDSEILEAFLLPSS